MSKKNLIKASATLGAVVLGISTATAVASADTIYTVKEGDTLYSISQKFNHDGSLVNALASQNHIKDINMIHVGDKLLIKSNVQIQPAMKPLRNGSLSVNQAAVILLKTVVTMAVTNWICPT